MNRPTVTQVRRYHWFDGDDRIEGLAIMSGQVHSWDPGPMTPDEAIQVTNNIVDTLEGDQQ